jgi:hypothetical protein
VSGRAIGDRRVAPRGIVGTVREFVIRDKGKALDPYQDAEKPVFAQVAQ